MEQYECIILEIEVENPIVTRSQFPDLISEILRNLIAQMCPVILQKLDVEDNLLMLYAGILARDTLLLEVIKEIPQFGSPVCSTVKLDVKHTLLRVPSDVYMIAQMRPKVKGIPSFFHEQSVFCS